MKFFYQENTIEAGVDEAGRGCLAGPVVAAAVILPQGFHHHYIKDSKKLSEKERNLAKEIIMENAISWAIGISSVEKIDKINILNATFHAMHEAIQCLTLTPELLLIDGNQFMPFSKIPHVCVVKGDEKFFSIAAASILAKTFRDEIMKNLDFEFPEYFWSKNKGYPTVQHRIQIKAHGMTKWHRKSFQCLPPGTLFDAQKI